MASVHLLLLALTFNMSFLSARLANTKPIMNSNSVTVTATNSTYPFRNISAVKGGIGVGFT